MKKPAHLIFRRLATISIFAVLAITPAIHARPKGGGIGSNHSVHDHDYDHRYDHYQYAFPYWWYADYGYRYDDTYMIPGQRMMGATGKIWPRKYSRSLLGAGIITGGLTE